MYNFLLLRYVTGFMASNRGFVRKYSSSGEVLWTESNMLDQVNNPNSFQSISNSYMSQTEPISIGIHLQFAVLFADQQWCITMKRSDKFHHFHQVTEVIYDPLEDAVVVTIGTERILLLDSHGQVKEKKI